jgi:hypothetical protein
MVGDRQASPPLSASPSSRRSPPSTSALRRAGPGREGTFCTALMATAEHVTT